LITRETVAVETPARSATWRIVRRLLRPFSGLIVELIRCIESHFLKRYIENALS
jgi:hypothetical protein